MEERIEVDLNKTEVKWLIERYEHDATQAEAVGLFESVKYDESRIADLQNTLSKFASSK